MRWSRSKISKLLQSRSQRQTLKQKRNAAAKPKPKGRGKQRSFRRKPKPQDLRFRTLRMRDLTKNYTQIPLMPLSWHQVHQQQVGGEELTDEDIKAILQELFKTEPFQKALMTAEKQKLAKEGAAFTVYETTPNPAASAEVSANPSSSTDTTNTEEGNVNRPAASTMLGGVPTEEERQKQAEEAAKAAAERAAQVASETAESNVGSQPALEAPSVPDQTPAAVEELAKDNDIKKLIQDASKKSEQGTSSQAGGGISDADRLRIPAGTPPNVVNSWENLSEADATTAINQYLATQQIVSGIQSQGGLQSTGRLAGLLTQPVVPDVPPAPVGTQFQSTQSGLRTPAPYSSFGRPSSPTTEGSALGLPEPSRSAPGSATNPVVVTQTPAPLIPSAPTEPVSGSEANPIVVSDPTATAPEPRPIATGTAAPKRNPSDISQSLATNDTLLASLATAITQKPTYINFARFWLAAQYRIREQKIQGGEEVLQAYATRENKSLIFKADAAANAILNQIQKATTANEIEDAFKKLGAKGGATPASSVYTWPQVIDLARQHATNTFTQPEQKEFVDDFASYAGVRRNINDVLDRANTKGGPTDKNITKIDTKIPKDNQLVTDIQNSTNAQELNMAFRKYFYTAAEIANYSKRPNTQQEVIPAQEEESSAQEGDDAARRSVKSVGFAEPVEDEGEPPKQECQGNCNSDLILRVELAGNKIVSHDVTGRSGASPDQFMESMSRQGIRTTSMNERVGNVERGEFSPSTYSEGRRPSSPTGVSRQGQVYGPEGSEGNETRDKLKAFGSKILGNLKQTYLNRTALLTPEIKMSIEDIQKFKSNKDPKTPDLIELRTQDKNYPFYILPEDWEKIKKADPTAENQYFDFQMNENDIPKYYYHGPARFKAAITGDYYKLTGLSADVKNNFFDKLTTKTSGYEGFDFYFPADERDSLIGIDWKTMDDKLASQNRVKLGGSSSDTVQTGGMLKVVWKADRKSGDAPKLMFRGKIKTFKLRQLMPGQAVDYWRFIDAAGNKFILLDSSKTKIIGKDTENKLKASVDSEQLNELTQNDLLGNVGGSNFLSGVLYLEQGKFYFVQSPLVNFPFALYLDQIINLSKTALYKFEVPQERVNQNTGNIENSGDKNIIYIEAADVPDVIVDAGGSSVNVGTLKKAKKGDYFQYKAKNTSGDYLGYPTVDPVPFGEEELIAIKNKTLVPKSTEVEEDNDNEGVIEEEEEPEEEGAAKGNLNISASSSPRVPPPSPPANVKYFNQGDNVIISPNTQGLNVVDKSIVINISAKEGEVNSKLQTIDNKEYYFVNLNDNTDAYIEPKYLTLKPESVSPSPSLPSASPSPSASIPGTRPTDYLNPNDFVAQTQSTTALGPGYLDPNVLLSSSAQGPGYLEIGSPSSSGYMTAEQMNRPPEPVYSVPQKRQQGGRKKRLTKRKKGGRKTARKTKRKY